jgi:hypothetical protein
MGPRCVTVRQGVAEGVWFLYQSKPALGCGPERTRLDLSQRHRVDGSRPRTSTYPLVPRNGPFGPNGPKPQKMAPFKAVLAGRFFTDPN